VSRQRGNEVENVVANLIIKKGGQILARNLYCKMGEIDIVALKARVLVFIEVKYRKSAIFGSAAEMVSYQKQRKIIKTAQYFLLKHPEFESFECRFDVVAITGKKLEWLAGCFE
jgi:putative endonuclease